MRLALLLAIAALPALAQEPAQEASCPFPGQRPMLVVQLFFGQLTDAHAPVSHRAWERFVAGTITPALPNGFTIYDAHGQYLDRATGAVGRERTAVLVVADDDTPAFRAHIADIAAAYRRGFHQVSVGMLTTAGYGGF